MKLEQITRDLLKRAIEMYLEAAYPGGDCSDAVAERARLPEDLDGPALLADDRFERVPADAPVADAQRFNLRLGNASYPHMKLGLDRVSSSDQFVLVVDTHDKHFAEMVQDKERAMYQQLLDHNRSVRERIEKAWNAAGMPTFESYLRGHLDGLRDHGKRV